MRGGVAWAAPPSPQVRPRPPLRCGRPEAAVAPLLPPLPRHGGPRRAGPLRGRLLAGAGLRRAGPGCAAGWRLRRRVLLRPAHLCGRHRHLPQPHLVGVLVRRQPGGAAGGAARRRGAGASQGSRGQPAAGAGARPQPPPLLRLRSRAALPRCRRRPGAAARRGPAGPPRRLQQDLLKTRLLKLLPLKVGEMLQIMEREFPTQCNRILSLWNNHCNHCGLCIKRTHRAISLPNAPISVLDWIVFCGYFSPFQNINYISEEVRTKKETNPIHGEITAACNILFFFLILITWECLDKKLLHNEKLLHCFTKVWKLDSL